MSLFLSILCTNGTTAEDFHIAYFATNHCHFIGSLSLASNQTEVDACQSIQGLSIGTTSI